MRAWKGVVAGGGPPVLVKQEGRGQGTTFKRMTAIGHDKNWLEPARSKMVEDSTSNGP